jgi:hypothetical protein
LFIGSKVDGRYMPHGVHLTLVFIHLLGDLVHRIGLDGYGSVDRCLETFLAMNQGFCTPRNQISSMSPFANNGVKTEENQLIHKPLARREQSTEDPVTCE